MMSKQIKDGQHYKQSPSTNGILNGETLLFLAFCLIMKEASEGNKIVHKMDQ